MTPQQIEHISRMNVASAYVGHDTALCRVLAQSLMYVDTIDRSIAPHLLLSGYWESWVTSAIWNHIDKHRGMHCADIGAHWGYYALLMARYGTVDAFEPNPRSAELLRANADINGARSITVYELALGSEIRTQKFWANREHSGGSHLQTRGGPEFTHIVNVITLDSLVRRYDFIKCDAESSEPLVWLGMRQQWEANRDLEVCIELLGESDERASLYDLLSQTAVVSWVTEGGLIEPLTRDQAITMSSVNMLWLRHQ